MNVNMYFTFPLRRMDFLSFVTSLKDSCIN